MTLAQALAARCFIMGSGCSARGAPSRVAVDVEGGARGSHPSWNKPLAKQPSVLFFHDHDAALWSQIAESLRSFAERCKSGAIASVLDLLQHLREIRRLTCNHHKLVFLKKAITCAPDVNICTLEVMLQTVMPFLALLVRDLPVLFRDGLRCMPQGRTDQVFLTRRQCVALLAAALFGAIPSPDLQVKAQARRLSMPGFDLGFVLDAEVTKCLCLLCYFAQVAEAQDGFLEEVVSFARRVEEVKSLEFWRMVNKPLTRASVMEHSGIEDSHENLQADFANEYLGGGVLQRGNVQEEIRFSVCPECLVGMLICEQMLFNEAIFIVGAQQFCRYRGYGGSFAFDSPYREVPRGTADRRGRVGPHIVALDALVFPGEAQYEEVYIHRELTKAFVACLGDLSEDACKRRPAFATGNWGCGVFGGDPQLKCLIQWIAASVAERDMVYFPYGDARMAGVGKVFDAIQSSGARCNDLFRLLTLGHKAKSVFKDVLKALPQGAAKPS
uniref:poly(ADP-ribose) glycohydrolase n=1 Tax=Alexandrium monilatum TaxID=311494 RepID=A0A7S4W4I1_9DINO